MSKSKKLFVILCAAMVCFFTGCSNSISKKNRTIVFNFGSYSNKSGSRNAIEDLAAKGLECFVDLSLQGSYKFKDTFSLNTQTSYAVEGIPVGARIKAVIEIYTFKDPADESTRLVLFSGESQTYTISESVNQITVKLNKNEEALELINGSGAQEEEDNSIKIYVSNLAKKNGNGDEWETDEDASHDGRTKDTAFDYIQSAIKWIADNGDGTSAYTIYLIDYDEAPFNQCMVFGDTTSSHDDNLRYKASSITLRSSDPDKLAICSDSHTILIATNVHVLFKNIQISCAEGKIILKTHADNNYRNYNVTLDQRTVLIGSKDKGKTSCAIYINTGTVKMDGNARIKNFLGSSSGGAVYIEDGYLNMKGNSVIENCKSEQNGGAVFLPGGTFSKGVTIEGNASIIDCEATGDGGAIYITMGGVDIYSGSITGCKATNGGAIYMSAVSADTNCCLYGGEISGNTATSKGGAIYLDSSNMTAKASMSGDIYVDPNNDIYSMGQAITIADSLTTSKEKIAHITFAAGMSVGGTVLSLDRWADEDAIKNSHSKFEVSVDGSNINYYVDENGYLQERN